MNDLTKWVLDWPRGVKRAVAFVVDACTCVLALWVTYSLRLERPVALGALPLFAVVVSLGLALPLFIKFGLYRAIFRYAGLKAMLAVVKAMAIYGVLFATLFSLFGVPGVPRSVGLSQPMLLFILIGATRAFARYWLGGMLRLDWVAADNPTQTLVYGAGLAGRQLVSGLHATKGMRVMGYLDDDERLHGQMLDGVPIYDVRELSQLIQRQRVSLVLLAIPSVQRARRNEILNFLSRFKIQVRTLPPLSDLTSGEVRLSDIRELELEDLLGRDPVSPNPLMMAKAVKGKTVMVTGAGGSIGSELCRQIVRVGPAKLLLVDSAEFALYTIHNELERTMLEESDIDVDVLPLLANVRDEGRMAEIMQTWKPDTVYHAAAYKHVPLVEHNPVEGILNNVFGTRTVAKQARLHKVSDFVLISTDKAVRPTNVMGASKRLAEMVLQAMAQRVAKEGGATRFSMVRFGNVLGSSGSVVPLFRRQIQEGGPITLTHQEVTRYFMTIPEAAQLVIQAGAMATGGDVHLLDMGEPVRIMDLARRMVMLSGLTVRDEENPAGDIAIKVTGLRPGEKLFEELLIGDDAVRTHHPLIMKAMEPFIPEDELNARLEPLVQALQRNDVPLILVLMQQLVAGYRPNGEVVDWVWKKTMASAA